MRKVFHNGKLLLPSERTKYSAALCIFTAGKLLRMIQRIQSVWLLLAAATAFGAFGVPFVSSDTSIAETLLADQTYRVQDHLVLMICFALAGALSLVSIFLYKKLQIQQRLTLLAAVLGIAGLVFGIGYYLLDVPSPQATAVALSPGLLLPPATILFALLAKRHIRKDEQLVRSLNSGRLR